MRRKQGTESVVCGIGFSRGKHKLLFFFFFFFFFGEENSWRLTSHESVAVCCLRIKFSCVYIHKHTHISVETEIKLRCLYMLEKIQWRGLIWLSLRLGDWMDYVSTWTTGGSGNSRHHFILYILLSIWILIFGRVGINSINLNYRPYCIWSWPRGALTLNGYNNHSVRTHIHTYIYIYTGENT